MNTAKSTNKHFYGVKKSMDITSTIFSILQVRTLAIAIACFSSASFATQGVDFIPPAQFQTMDKYQVNAAGGQVSPTIQTVAIGGAMGLKHSITAMGNYFDLSHSNNGYQDAYAGGLKFTHLGTTTSPISGYSSVPAGGGDATVMRASFLGQHADFIVIKNDDGSYQWGTYAGTNYHYETVGDKRHTLERTRDGLVWTQPDGTQVFLSTTDMTNSASAHQDFRAEKIVYPNGFTITVGSLVGVMTNTGFALRYDFDSTDPGLDAAKQQKSQAIPYGSNVPPLTGSGFRDANPKYVTAINMAIEACDISSATSCTLYKNWPKATFTWPGGMPRTMFIDRSTFSVTNAAGVRTDLIYQAFDAGLVDGYNVNPQDYTAGTLIAPRLVEIKSAGATASTAFYTYKNEKLRSVTQTSGSTVTSGPFSSTKAIYDNYLLPGVLTSEAGAFGTKDYASGDVGSGSPDGPIVYGHFYRSGHDVMVQQYTTSPVGIFEKILDWKGDRQIDFELSYRNFVTKEKSISATVPDKVYEYDNRGNLYKITQGSAVVQASYPTTCTNRKTCNKPDWVMDPNGNKTFYTYHADSGEVQTITSPPDKNGISAVVRYGYEKKFASWKLTLNGSPVQTSDGIYLKVSEKTCNSTRTLGDACMGNSAIGLSAAQDEVVTTYKYDNNNLLLTEMTVTAADSTNAIRTKRTCYQYDIYGNRIGETQPNAQRACTP